MLLKSFLGGQIKHAFINFCSQALSNSWDRGQEDLLLCCLLLRTWRVEHMNQDKSSKSQSPSFPFLDWPPDLGGIPTPEPSCCIFIPVAIRDRYPDQKQHRRLKGCFSPIAPGSSQTLRQEQNQRYRNAQMLLAS